MPIYEYQCPSCGDIIEKIQSFTAKAPEQCEKCGLGPMIKLVSQSSFILKGSGWYKDGYSSSPNSSSDLSSSASVADSSSGSASVADSSSGSDSVANSSSDSSPNSSSTSTNTTAV